MEKKRTGRTHSPCLIPNALPDNVLQCCCRFKSYLGSNLGSHIVPGQQQQQQQPGATATAMKPNVNQPPRPNSTHVQTAHPNSSHAHTHKKRRHAKHHHCVGGHNDVPQEVPHRSHALHCRLQQAVLGSKPRRGLANHHPGLLRHQLILQGPYPLLQLLLSLGMGTQSGGCLWTTTTQTQQGARTAPRGTGAHVRLQPG
jgi:hypothetical protein